MEIEMLDLVDSWLVESPFSSSTISSYRRALQLFIKHFPDPADVTALQLKRWLDSQKWGSSHKWVCFNGIKGFLRWKYGAGHPALTLKMVRRSSPPQRVLSINQARQLLQSFDRSTPKGTRDLCMAGIFLDCGLRVSEVCRLEVNKILYDTDSGTNLLQVIVKGGAWSTRSFSPTTAIWLSEWMKARTEFLKEYPGRDKGKLFIGIGGNTPGQPMTRHGVQKIVNEWGRVAKIGQLSPHDFRRSMASIATLAGAPEDIVMKGGGWKNTAVFRRYTVGVGVADMKPYFPTSTLIKKDRHDSHS